MATAAESAASSTGELPVDGLLVVLCHGLLGTAGQMAALGRLVGAALAVHVPCADPAAPFWRRVDVDFAPHMLSLVHNMGTAHLQPARDIPACTAAMALVARIVAHDCCDWFENACSSLVPCSGTRGTSDSDDEWDDKSAGL